MRLESLIMARNIKHKQETGRDAYDANLGNRLAGELQHQFLLYTTFSGNQSTDQNSTPNPTKNPTQIAMPNLLFTPKNLPDIRYIEECQEATVMGAFFMLGECSKCKNFFKSNPNYVPSLTANGHQHIFCEPCMDGENARRAADPSLGLPQLFIHPEAYRIAEEG